MTYLILAQILVAISIVAAKYLIHYIPVIVLLAIRFSIASVILLPLHWLTAKEHSIRYHLAQLDRKDWFYIVAQALTAGVFFNALMLLGLNYTDANIAGIITSALPALIAVLSWLILKERISNKTILCVLLATVGLIIIACEKIQGESINNSILGDLIIIGSLFPEAAYYIFTKMHPNRLPVFLVSTLLNVINALVVLVVLVLINPSYAPISIFNWLILVMLGLTSGMFYVLWFLGCQKVDGVKSSLATACMPVATVLFAWILLHEQLTSIQLVGMALVILSILINGY